MLRALYHLYTKYSSEAPQQEGKVTFAVPMRSQDTEESAGAGAGDAALFLQLHHFSELLNLTSTGASFCPSENCGKKCALRTLPFSKEKYCKRDSYFSACDVKCQLLKICCWKPHGFKKQHFLSVIFLMLCKWGEWEGQG